MLPTQRLAQTVLFGLLATGPLLAQADKSIGATLLAAEVIAKVRVVDGSRVEVLRVYGDGEQSLVGQKITLESIPWNGKTGIAIRTCLCVTNLPGHDAPGTHWLIALKRHGEGKATVYRNPLGDGLLGARVPAKLAPVQPDDPAASILAELLAALDDPDATIRESALKVLRRWDGPFLRQPGVTLWRDEKVAARLLALADDPSEQVRWLLAWMIHEEAGAAGEAVLLRFLFDDARLVRQPAQHHLGRRGHDDFVAEMKALIDYRLDEWSSEMMQQDFDRKLRPRDIEARIARMLGEGKPEERARAAWMLGLQDPNAKITTGLITALTEEAFEVRRWAAWSLGRVGGEGAAAALAKHEDDEDARVLVQVGRSLAALGERKTGLQRLRTLVAGDDVRAAAQAIDAIAAIGGIKALDAVAIAVQDPRPLIRAYAGAALPKFTGVAEHQVAALRDDLSRDEHPLVRAAVR